MRLPQSAVGGWFEQVDNLNPVGTTCIGRRMPGGHHHKTFADLMSVKPAARKCLPAPGSFGFVNRVDAVRELQVLAGSLIWTYCHNPYFWTEAAHFAGGVPTQGWRHDYNGFNRRYGHGDAERD